MLNEPTYPKVTMDAMGTLWLLGGNGCYGRNKFSELILSKLFGFFSVRALIMKVQSNKMCLSIKTTIKIHFPWTSTPG